MPCKIQAGFSLIEVLISLALLSFALLGLDAMEIMSLRNSRENYFFSLAVNQLQSITDRLWVLGNRANMRDQINIWNQENHIMLPQGVGYVEGLYPSYTISIYWGQWNQHSCHSIQLGQSGCIQEEVNLTA